jgi:membrane protease YdiL (CAAX protease family)
VRSWHSENARLKATGSLGEEFVSMLRLSHSVAHEPSVTGVSQSSAGWRPLLIFFALAYALSWLLWSPLVFSSLGWIDRSVSPYWHLAGGLGPMAAAVIVRVSGLGHGQTGSRVGARRFSRWLLVGGLIPVGLFLVSVVVIAAVNGEWPAASTLGASTEYPDLPLAVYWLANLFFYGFGEEVGWRGFALPRLIDRFGAFQASSVLSLFWAAWHIPLFAFADGFDDMGPFNIVMWYFSLWTGSLLLTWLYLRSGGNIAAVALFHGALDITINSPVDSTLQTLMGVLVTLCGLGALWMMKRTQPERHVSA